MSVPSIIGYIFTPTCRQNNSIDQKLIVPGSKKDDYRVCSTAANDTSKVMSIFVDEVIPKDATHPAETTISIRDYLAAKSKSAGHEYVNHLEDLTWEDVVNIYYPTAKLDDANMKKAVEALIADNGNAATPFKTLRPQEQNAYWWYTLTADRWYLPNKGYVPDMVVRLSGLTQVVNKCAGLEGPNGDLAKAIGELDAKINEVRDKTVNTNSSTFDINLEALYTYYTNEKHEEVYTYTEDDIVYARAAGREFFMRGNDALIYAQTILGGASDLKAKNEKLISDTANNKGCENVEQLLKDVNSEIIKVNFVRDHLTAQPKPQPTTQPATPAPVKKKTRVRTENPSGPAPKPPVRTPRTGGDDDGGIKPKF
jgi:hypothetical protein